MLTICMALKAELLPFTEFFPLQLKQKMASGTLYRAGQIHLLRTGVGSIAARSFLSYLKQYRPDSVWNVGLAGALNPVIPSGDIFAINRVRNVNSENWIMLSAVAAADTFIAKDLLTVSQAVTSSVERDRLQASTSADLVDMETYLLAEKCQTEHIPFASFKMVSDLANDQTEKDFLYNLSDYSRRLAIALHPLLLQWLK